MTPGQNEIFDIIFYRKYPRTHAMTYTQYGKSVICALATLTRVTTWSEMWAIVAPTTKKAGIIMGFIIDHIFDHGALKAMFRIGKHESLERIRRERSKDKVTFRLGAGEVSGVYTLTTEGKRVKDVLDAIMGFGAKNIILDESGLIDDPQYAGVKRMLGGYKDNFLFEIGNPFRRNHFLRSSLNPKYFQIKVDWEQGVREGRVTKEFIDEMKEEAFFDILYDVKFPEEEAIDEKGYMPLLTESDIEKAENRSVEAIGYKKLGQDVGEGGNYNAFVIRQDNYAWIKEKNRESDLMKTAEKTGEISKEEKIAGRNIAIDGIGIGAGVVSRCIQLGMAVIAVIGGGKPTERTEEELKKDPIDYINLRAEMYWKARRWIKEGGALKPNKDWKQLTKIKYKVNSDKQIQIMSKEDMRKLGIESPDVADGFAYTFHPGLGKVKVFGKASEDAKPYYSEIGQ